MAEQEIQTIEAMVVAPKDALALNRAPDIVLEEAQRAAKALTQVIENKPKKVQFNGKTYLQFEDWQTLGRFYGVTANVKSTKYTEFGENGDKVHGFEAQAEALLVATNQVISSAEALCLDDEPNWSRKPLFQLKSMAQTRACAKALRNVLAWVVVLAGYAPTPAEEMGGSEESGIKPPQSKCKDRTPEQASKSPDGHVPLISEPQRKRLWAISKNAGISEDLLKEIVGKHGFQHGKDITRDKYEAVVEAVQKAGNLISGGAA